MKLSLIICTHNPRRGYLDRVLAGLQRQTLHLADWELLLIDNASEQPLSEKWKLDWHPQGRILREDRLGLTAARLRAAEEFKGDLALFVDDDNVLDVDYLQEALRLAEEWPILGAWGGQYFAEYEAGMPPDWEVDRWSSFLEKDVWSNLPDRNAAPYGGGMVLRRPVLKEFYGSSGQSRLRQLLGRAGKGLGSYEDFDMAFTACDLGYGIGRFRSLKLTHLIPPERTTRDYLLKLCEESEFTDVIFRRARGESVPLHSIEQKFLFVYSIARELFKGRKIDFHLAGERGRSRARNFLRSLPT
jgi:glycosyltransferase involved in cell wall biosynthesis